ncbi:hypothetical protein KO515_10390 [Winogradskyella psychrotolerans]|nr:hypothetical protein [Winogradskyella psychrotolerans]
MTLMLPEIIITTPLFNMRQFITGSIAINVFFNLLFLGLLNEKIILNNSAIKMAILKNNLELKTI